MTSKMSTKRALLMSALSLLLCVSMLVSTTFAWFTDEVKSGTNVIATGNLDVKLTHSNRDTSERDMENEEVGENVKLFTDVAADKWEPGAVAYEKLTVTNAGTLALKYDLAINVAAANSVEFEGNSYTLADALQVAFVDASKLNGTREAAIAAGDEAGWASLSSTVKSGTLLEKDSYTYGVVIYWEPTENDNIWNLKNGNKAEDGAEKLSIELGVHLTATQLMKEKDSYGDDYDEDAKFNQTDVWDGTVDTSWYNGNDTEFTLSTAEQLAGLAALVDAGETFEGKTITLASDLDLYAVDANGEAICFDPIGSYRKNTPFKGTFDAQGHAVKNLNQNTWALDNGYYYDDLGLGLFGKVQDATVKNLVMDGAGISGESAICGIVAGTAYGDCTFENITVQNSKANDYQYYAGGVVGWASGNHVYKNINIDDSVIIGSQWGDFGNCNGGIIGGSGSSAEIRFEDCTVACRIDATNDIVSAYQWWCYRNSGMLIGNTGHTATDEAVTNVAAPNVTCVNVTVIYGDWANYTYCEFAGTGYPYVRVQAGVSVDGYSNVRYGHPTDANGNVVVDDNHVHNDGEDHHLLIAFDQLFGGKADHRYCQYGIATHPGVTVVYNNK